MTYIAAQFFGLQSEIVNFGYSLSRILFGTQPNFDIHRTFSFLVYRVKTSTLIILYLILYSARSRSLTYIVHFLDLRSEIVNFGYSLSRTQFSKRQKCDMHRTFFKFTA